MYHMACHSHKSVKVSPLFLHYVGDDRCPGVKNVNRCELPRWGGEVAAAVNLANN